MKNKGLMPDYVTERPGQCCYVDQGQRCQLDGSMALAGGQPYCRTHFASMMGWDDIKPDPSRKETIETLKALCHRQKRWAGERDLRWAERIVKRVKQGQTVPELAAKMAREALAEFKREQPIVARQPGEDSA